MRQRPITPKTKNYARCDAPAHVIDWDYNMRYQVMCDKNHTATGKFNTVHRAICKWNNTQNKLS